MPDHALALIALTVASVAALALPHLLPLHRVAPRTAAAVWLAALGLRAVLALALATSAFIWIPHYSGAAPALWMAASATAFGVLMLIVAARLRRMLRERSLGTGPAGSLVIADRGVYVALTGVGRPEVLVSAGALDQLDGDELRASIAHERGHQRLRHRGWSLAGSALHALARPFPAGDACRRGLRLGLERQADEWAVRATRDPLALASAICKSAQAAGPAGALAVGSAPAGVRVRQLLADGPARSGALAERAAAALAATLIGLCGALGVTVMATVSHTV